MPPVCCPFLLIHARTHYTYTLLPFSYTHTRARAQPRTHTHTWVDTRRVQHAYAARVAELGFVQPARQDFRPEKNARQAFSSFEKGKETTRQCAHVLLPSNVHMCLSHVAARACHSRNMLPIWLCGLFHRPHTTHLLYVLLPLNVRRALRSRYALWPSHRPRGSPLLLNLRAGGANRKGLVKGKRKRQACGIP